MLIKDVRKGVPSLLKSTFNWLFVKFYISIILYAMLIVFLLYKIGYWNFSLLKDTIVWVVLSGLVLCFKTISTKDRKRLLIGAFKDSIVFTVILQFISGTYTFPLVVELISFPVLIFVSIMMAIADKKEETKIVSKLFNKIIVIYGLVSLLTASSQMIDEYEQIFTLSTLQSFMLSLILLITFIPFIYFFALYVLYSEIFSRVKYGVRENKAVFKYLKFKTRLMFHIKLFELEKFNNSSVFSREFFKEKADVDKYFKRYTNEGGQIK